jgi:hypothetical protein
MTMVGLVIPFSESFVMSDGNSVHKSQILNVNNIAVSKHNMWCHFNWITW